VVAQAVDDILRAVVALHATRQRAPVAT